ncbi:MAG: hypothetical protein H7240_10495, partial [Glaciimonas sp.]|nr:hypothetical protein [Glaciimonas sp.]
MIDTHLQKDYAVHPKLALAWNHYMAAGHLMGTSGTKIMGKYAAILRKYMVLFYDYRRQYIKGLEHTVRFAQAHPQEHEDMHSYNTLLQGDLALLAERAAIATLNASIVDTGIVDTGLLRGQRIVTKFRYKAHRDTN